MNKILINKESTVKGDIVVITETTESTMNREQLQFRLQDLGQFKMQLKDENRRVLDEYNKILEEEVELKELISQLDGGDNMEEI